MTKSPVLRPMLTLELDENGGADPMPSIEARRTPGADPVPWEDEDFDPLDTTGSLEAENFDEEEIIQARLTGGASTATP